MTCTSLLQLWEKVRAITDVELWYDCPTLHYAVFGIEKYQYWPYYLTFCDSVISHREQELSYRFFFLFP